MGVAQLLRVARPLLTPALAVLVGGSYLLALILLRELGAADWRAFHGNRRTQARNGLNPFVAGRAP